MKLIENVILDLRKDFSYNLSIKQDDVGSRFLDMTIKDNGQVVNLTNHTAKLYIAKPDGTIIFNNAIIVDAVSGIVEIELTSQALAVAGLLKCELAIYGTDASVVSSKIFSINVMDSLRNDTAIESQNEFGALVDAMSELSEYENYKAKINENTTKIGTSVLETTAQDLSEAVNELVYSDNTIQAQLAEITQDKIDKNGSGQVTWANIAQDARLNISGGNTAVVGVDSVLPINITRGAVLPSKTSFFDIGKIADTQNCKIEYGKRINLPSGVYNLENDANSFVIYVPLADIVNSICYCATNTKQTSNAQDVVLFVNATYNKINHTTNTKTISKAMATNQISAGAVYGVFSFDISVNPNILKVAYNHNNKNQISDIYYKNNMIRSKNLVDENSLLNFYPDTTGIAYSAGYISTNVIQITPTKTYYNNLVFGVNTAYINYFDENYNHIKRVSLSNNSFTPSADVELVNARYMIISATISNNIFPNNLVISEDELIEHVPYYVIDEKFYSQPTKTSELTNDSEYVKSSEIVLPYSNQKTYNIFDISTAVRGRGFYRDIGTTYAVATSTASDYIDITGALSVSVNYEAYYLFYDANHTYISANASKYFSSVIPTNAKYLRLEILNYTEDILSKFVCMIGGGTLSYQNTLREAINTDKLYLYHILNSYDIRTGFKGIIADSIGDSITYQNVYQLFVSAYFGFGAYYNHGIAGTSVSGAGANAFWQNVRINALSEVAKLITINGGMNDYTTAIGTISLDNYDTNTFVGAYNVMLSKIYYKYLKLSSGKYTSIDYSGITQLSIASEIMILLITPSYSLTRDMTNYANAVIEIGKLWHLPVANVFHNSGMNEQTKDLYLPVDGIHPLLAGHKKMSSVIIGTLKEVEPIYW